MRQCNIPVNGSKLCIEEVQIASLTIMGLCEKKIVTITGFQLWEVKHLRCSVYAKLGVTNAKELLYCHETFGFTRTGLFNGQPLFTRAQQAKLLALAPYLHLENPAIV